MTEKFIFKGQTTFINQPNETIIQNFQNSFITGDGSDNDKANIEIAKLVDLILKSQDLQSENKEETTQFLHSLAKQIKEKKANKLTLKKTLQKVQNVISKAADIATPALIIITTILKLFGIN